MGNPLVIVFIICLLAARVYFSLLVGRVASSFHRSSMTWAVVAALTSPLLMYIILCIVGDPVQAQAFREREERIRQQHPDRTDVHEAALNEMTCPDCGATINPVTEDGLHSSESEPWLLICNKCQRHIEPGG